MSLRSAPLGLLFTVATFLPAQSSSPTCHWEQALRLHQSGDLEAALHEYQNCVAAEPDRVDARSNLAVVLGRLGRFQEAIEQYQAALKSAPPQYAAPLRLNLALAYYKSLQLRDAIRELETVRRDAPNQPNALLLLADCHLRLGDYDQVVASLSGVDPSQPGMEAVDYMLGLALIRSDNVKEGQRHLDRILGKGESAEGHYLLGSAMYISGDFPAAVKEFGKAAAMNPDLPSLQSYYGRALLFTGDADAAAAAFRKELASNPNDFDANFQLASILAHRGKSAEAVRPLLERAVSVNPNSVEAKEALAHGFHDEPRRDPGVAIGTLAPAIGSLDFKNLTKPVMLVFGSYTCPKLRYSADALRQLHAEYGARINFRLVYIREAHAEGGEEAQWQSTINKREGIAVAPVRNLADKQAHANLCLRKLSLPFTSVVDAMDAPAERAYNAWPSRVYLVDRAGRVAFDSRLGEQDFQPERLDRAIREILDKDSPR
jgi:tetratricopeptide (TPR) repeat protein